MIPSTQKVLGNWFVKETSPAFIQQLLGWLHEMLFVFHTAHGLPDHRKRQVRGNHDTGQRVVKVHTEVSRICSEEEGNS